MWATTSSGPLAKRAFLIGLAFVMMLAIATRFYHLGYESLWLDEGITFARSRMPLRQLCDNAIRRYHNPFYFILVHYVMTLGDSELVLRLPSAIAGILKTAVVCGIGSMIGGARIGLLASLILVLMPTQLTYDQEARMYGLLGLAAACIMFAQLWLLRNIEVASGALVRTPQTPPRRRAILVWAGYALACVVALYLHNTAALLVFATASSLLIAGALSSSRRCFLWSWLVTHAAIALAFAPWVPTLLDQSGKMHERGWWAVEPDAEAVFSNLTELYGVGMSAPGLLVVSVGLALYGAWRLRSDVASAGTLLWLSAAGPLLLGLVTLYQPMFILRLMLWSAIPFAVLVAYGIGQIRPSGVAAALAGVVLLGGLLHLRAHYYGVRQKPNWEAAVEYLADHVEPRDVIWATGGSEARSVYYYLNREHRKLRPLRIDFDHSKLAQDIRPHYGDDTSAIWTLRARIRPETKLIHAKLDAVARRTLSLTFGPELELARYVPIR
jgi:hypothetical protein